MAEVPRLGALEREVMDVLWDCPDDLCTRQVLGRLAEELAYTTVATVLTNLARKEMVERFRADGRWGYRPLHSREAYAAGLMAQALAEAGDRGRALELFRDLLGEGDRAVLCTAEEGRAGPDVDATARWAMMDR